MIIRFRSRHLVLWLLGNLMVCESPGKRLVVQWEDATPPVHPAYDKLHCCLIVILSCISVHWSYFKFKVDLYS
jgi:hypothetical protein